MELVLKAFHEWVRQREFEGIGQSLRHVLEVCSCVDDTVEREGKGIGNIEGGGDREDRGRREGDREGGGGG